MTGSKIYGWIIIYHEITNKQGLVKSQIKDWLQWLWYVLRYNNIHQIQTVDVELHPLLKNVLNLFVCIKLNFFSYNLPFFIWFIPLVDLILIKPAPRRPRIQFEESGCNSVRVQYQWTKSTGRCIEYALLNTMDVLRLAST